MTEPLRFADRDDIKGRLVRAARGETSSDRARRRAAAAVVAAGTLVGSTAATSAAASGASVVLTKWLVVGAVVATLGGGATVVVNHRVHPPAPATLKIPPRVAPAIATVAPAAVAPSTATAAAAEPPALGPPPALPSASLPSAPPAPIAPTAPIAPVARPPRATEEPPAPSLAGELVALDSAKRLLDQGDSAGALIALDGYAHSFPRGRLQPEALALRAEALERHGDHALAIYLYERLVREHPESPLCDRVRAVVGAAR